MTEKLRPPELENEILNFDEFRDRSGGAPTYNNFFMLFRGDYDDFFSLSEEEIRSREEKSGEQHVYLRAYKRLREEHPDLDKKLRQLVQEAEANYQRDRKTKFAISISPYLEPADANLYEAYKIMRGYGVPNAELGGIYPKKSHKK